MANLIWSIGLAVVGITGLWLAGSQRHLGWALGLAAQLLWIVFAIASGQYGFIASALAYGFVYARNWRRARRAQRQVHVRLHVDTTKYQEAIRQLLDRVNRGDA